MLELPVLYKRVKQAVPQTKMVIVGKGTAKKQLKKELPEVIFIDWFSQDTLPATYSSADILILASGFDTFCNVVLEALSCRLPVIACTILKALKISSAMGKMNFWSERFPKCKNKLLIVCKAMKKKILENLPLRGQKTTTPKPLLMD